MSPSKKKITAKLVESIKSAIKTPPAAKSAATASGKAGVKKAAASKKAVRKSAASDSESTLMKKQEDNLPDSISDGLAKHGHKKRGWRDIEALTERARLKSLLTDIWHEDIELDSDIFGETDHSAGYYTDKVEEIEVETDDDDDEEWEEFEEDEN